MTELISNFTAAAVSLLLTVGFKDPAWGIAFATGLMVIWVQIFGTDTVPVENFVGIWFWSIVAFAIVGGVLVSFLKTIPFIDPRYGKVNTGKSDMAPWRVLGKYLLFLLIIGIAHIIFELNVGTSIIWLTALIAIVIIAIAYIVLYALFQGDEVYYGKFDGYKNLSGDDLKATVKAHVRSFVFWLGIIHVASAIVFAVLYPVLDEPENYWNLWTLLILATVTIITLSIVFCKYNS